MPRQHAKPPRDIVNRVHANTLVKAPHRHDLLAWLHWNGQELVFVFQHDLVLSQGMRLEKVVKLLESLDIEDKVTGNIIKWKLTPLQLLTLERCWGKKKVIVGKPRQVGLSTLFCALDVLWIVDNVSNGNRGKCAIILDTEDKSLGRLEQCRDFADQLELPSRKSGNRLLFSGGAEIVALTAGGKRTGSSFNFSRFHLSEIPYWQNAESVWGSIKPAMTDEGQCIVETTFDITNNLGRIMWYGKNRFENIFLSVEDEPRYRHDPTAITEEQWRWMQAEGYTNREAASWFVNIGVEEEAMGDTAHAFRLFPQTPEHMFRAAASRWIMSDPEVVTPIRKMPVPGNGETFHVEIFHEPDDDYGYITAVDTASGKERDSSAIVVIDRFSKKILASFDSNKIIPHDLAHVLAFMQELYRNPGITLYGEQIGEEEPLVIIEGGGIGDATQHEARRRGIPFVSHNQTDARKYRCLALAKQAIEQGKAFGPRRLLDECQELRVDELNKKRWLGKKDMVMALGMALSYTEDTPHVEDPKVKRANTHAPGTVADMNATLRRERSLRVAARSRRRGGW